MAVFTNFFSKSVQIVCKYMVKVSVVLEKRYKLKDDTYQLKIKVFRNHKAMYIPTGLFIKDSEWDMESRKVVHRRDKTALNNKLLTLHNEVVNKIASLQKEGTLRSYSNVKLFDYLCGTPDSDKDKLFKTQFLQYLKSCKTQRTQDIYISTLKHIEIFSDINSLYLEDIDTSWLDDFCTYLYKEGCKAVNTRAIHLRNIRAILNYAKKNGLISNYVFDKYKIKKEETIKRALTIDEIRKLYNAELPQRQSVYRDIFFLIIFLMGINLVDLSRLKAIENGRINYKRAKTGTLYSIKVEDEALRIINKYKGDRRLLYIFDKYKNYNDYKRRFNENMKAICKRMGINSNVSSYWARHTFATLMYDIGIPMDIIADCLGHKSYHNKITSIYVKKSTKRIDEANRKLIDYIIKK